MLSYIRYCTDSVTAEKQIRIYPNQKPWMTRTVRKLLEERNTAFRSGDVALYSSARANLKRGIRKAKLDYKRKIEDHLQSNNSRQVWSGVQHITNYRTNLNPVVSNASLAEELNHFFARFEVETPGTSSSHPGNNNFRVVEQEVRRTLLSVNPRKAAGPNGIPGQTLKYLTRIFN